MSFNLVPKFYPTGRDFGIVDDDVRDVVAMEATFDADWQGTGAAAYEAAQPGDDLVWSPGSRVAILALINGATEYLEIYNEEMADPDVIAALIEAVRRGVEVDIDMTYSGDWKSAFTKLVAAGANVRTYSAHADRYIHAKMIVADGKQAFVGSENFSISSFDHNRELGIMLANQAIIRSLEQTFADDWQEAAPFKNK